MTNEGLPAQPPEGLELNLYTYLKVVYILGFFEALFGLAVIGVEAFNIALFYDPSITFPLDIAGIFVGIVVVVTGVCDFCAGRSGVLPETRRKLFIIGIVLSLISLAAVGVMLVISVLRAHYLYEDVRDKEGRDNSSFFKNLAYILSLEGLRHAAQLRAMLSAIYAFCAIILLSSLFLNCVNVRKNKDNTGTAAIYARVPRDEVKLTSDGNAVK